MATTALLIVGFILLQALLTGAEMALTSLNDEKLDLVEKSGASPRRVQRLREFLADPSALLQTTLLCVNLAVVGAATWLMVAMAEGSPAPSPLWALALLPLTLLVGDVLPKSYFQARAIVWAPRLVGVLSFLSRLLWPMLALMDGLSRRVTRRRQVAGPTQPFVVREELKLRIQDQTSTPELGALEREMIANIFDFKDTTVGEVMIPLIDVHAIAIDRPLVDAVQILVEQGHSRIPVYRERVDHVVGILYAFDLLYEADLGQSLKKFIRPAFYVPRSMPISKLLLELQRQRLGMAVVVDEYGGSEGAVTLEDILEEIVGDIEDEYDQKNQKWRKIGPSEYLVSARLELYALAELLGQPFPEGEYETVGGFVLHGLGRIPRVGEIYRAGGVTFTVRRATERAIVEIAVAVEVSGGP